MVKSIFEKILCLLFIYLCMRKYIFTVAASIVFVECHEALNQIKI